MVMLLFAYVESFLPKNVKLYENFKLKRSNTPCIVFFTGGSSIMPPIIYSDFIDKLVNKELAVCVPQFRYKNLNSLFKELTSEYKSVIVMSHSSGNTVALNAIENLQDTSINKIILLDPVNTRIQNLDKRYNLYGVRYLMLANALKSYKINNDPFGLAFIPFLRISLDTLDLNDECILKTIDTTEYGHCDILDNSYANFMHWTRISVGNKERDIEIYKSLLADEICKFVME